MTQYVYGKNVVKQLLQDGKPIHEVLIQEGIRDTALEGEIKKRRIPVKVLGRKKMDQLLNGNHQGIAACIDDYKTWELEELLESVPQGKQPLLVMLDGLEDPHNLGAIIRTANLAGAHGVIIPKRRSVGLTSTVAKTSAGALNYTPVAKVTNLVRTIEELKEKGIWFVCADMGGESMYRLNLTGPIGMIVGNEGEGVSRLVREACDFTASIPMKGDIDSLNASVAAGVLAYEIVRQRLKAE